MYYVQYITLDQYSWFDTGIIPDINTKIELDITTPNSVSADWRGFVGAQNSDDHTSTFQIRRYNRNNQFSARVGDGVDADMGPGYTANTRYTLTLDKDYFNVNGTNYAVGTTTMDTCNNTLYINGIHNTSFAGSNYRSAGGTYHRLKVWNNGVLVGDFRPAVDNNVVGFYDLVSSSFKSNLGTGTPTAGPIDSTIYVDASKTYLSHTGETISIDVNSQNAWILSTSGGNFLTFSETGDTSAATITATAPSYTGTTAREEYLIFTDTVSLDTAELTIKQKKYSAGQPFYLGGDEIVEIYLGDDSISETYLGEDLVFSSGSGPTPPPTPTGRTLTISDIPTPPVPTEGEYVFMSIGLETPVDTEQGIYTYMEFRIDYENDEYVVTMTIDDGNGNPVTGYTTAYTNSALTISGPWGDEVNIYYDYSDGDINCEQVPIDSDVSETFTGDTISLTFPTLEVNGECQCGKTGGEWDYDNEVCLHPTGLLIKLTSIPDDGDSHTVTVTDGDGRECTLTMDMSDYSYTDSYDSEDKYSGYMEVDDLANGNAEWMIEGNMYGTYTIDVDGFTLPSEPDYDGSGNFVVVNYDFSQVDSMDDYCSRDAYDCENGGGTYDCQTGECE